MNEYSFALYVFDEMCQMGTPVNDYTSNIAINCYCCMKRVDLGFATIGFFLKKGYEPNVTTFSTLVKGLFLDVKVADVVKLFKKVLDLRLCKPGDVLILTVIEGLCKAGQIFPAHDLIRRLERTRLKPGVKAYNALIDGLCKTGRVDDAFHLFSKMRD